MANKVLSYRAEPYGEYQLGFCNVDVAGKCRIVLKVFKSKTGNICCGFTSVKIEGNWVSSFGFINKEKERGFLNECREQVIKIMPQAQEPVQEDVPVDQELPF